MDFKCNSQSANTGKMQGFHSNLRMNWYIGTRKKENTQDFTDVIANLIIIISIRVLFTKSLELISQLFILAKNIFSDG